ncbi:twin-arginine translocase subunit TatC [Flavitalea flava]
MALNLFNRNSQQEEMSFVDHLEALRWHIVRSAFAIVTVAIVIFINMNWIFDKIIRGPIRSDFVSYVGLCNLGRKLHMGDALCLQSVSGLRLQTTQFSSQFISSINIAIIGGFIVAFPYIFWEFWRFVKPALSAKEKKSSRGAIFFVTFFFLLGVSFGYFLLAPFTFSFLANYSVGAPGAIQTVPTLDDYIENLIDIIIGSGLAFQLPLISYVLTRIGLITPSFLRTYRKYAYVAILFVAAIITPSPDWMSQTIVALPLILLYELSIRISIRVSKEMAKKDKEEWS